MFNLSKEKLRELELKKVPGGESDILECARCNNAVASFVITETGSVQCGHCGHEKTKVN